MPEPLSSEWSRSVSSLKAIENILINRYILNDKVVVIELFGFRDISIFPYGAVVYLNCYTQSGSHTYQLLASKSKIASVKNV